MKSCLISKRNISLRPIFIAVILNKSLDIDKNFKNLNISLSTSVPKTQHLSTIST